MRSPLLHMLFLFAWFLWTALFIPFHTRGSVPLAPGTAVHSCCSSDAPTSKDAKPNPDNCAICNAVSLFTTPPPFILFDARLALLCDQPPAPQTHHHGANTPQVAPCRGPPLA